MNAKGEAKTLAELLRREMRRQEWNGSDLARRVGVAPSMVSKWLRGTKPNPDSCDRLADALGLPLDRILRLAGHLPPDYEDRNPDTERLVSLLRRIRLNDDRMLLLRSTLEGMLRIDQAAEAESPAPRPQSSPAAAGRGR